LQGGSNITQGVSDRDTFTISVAEPVSSKDVQVRYFFAGELSSNGSIATTTASNRINIVTGVDGHSARTFKAIAYSPGCQFVTISVDDLSASSRQSDFQCQSLSTVELPGRIALSRFADRDLQIEALYVCQWAGRFFDVPGAAFSPFCVARAHVETDGSFALVLPDFAADPLWGTLSHDATLMFVLVDARSGQRLAALKSPADLSRAGSLKVSSSYGQVELAIQP
jgi:hypothetical protein